MLNVIGPKKLAPEKIDCVFLDWFVSVCSFIVEMFAISVSWPSVFYSVFIVVAIVF